MLFMNCLGFLIVTVTGLVAMFGVYAAEIRQMQRSRCKTGFATQVEREKVEDARHSASN